MINRIKIAHDGKSWVTESGEGVGVGCCNRGVGVGDDIKGVGVGCCNRGVGVGDGDKSVGVGDCDKGVGVGDGDKVEFESINNIAKTL